MKVIDINVDIGEGFPWDRELLSIASSANICIGGYAGSPELCLEVAAMARQNGVEVGAHVGYEDPEGFGRRSISTLPSDAAIRMVQRLTGILPELRPAYIKPHGAFYNESATGWVKSLLTGIMGSIRLPLLGLPNSAHAHGDWRLIREGFADRAYREDGTLVPRSEPGAIITDVAQMQAQALQLASQVDSICIHGDEPDCVARAAALREVLESNGWTIRSAA